MTKSYNLTGQNEAQVNTTETEETEVTVCSTKPIKPRTVYVGEAKMAFSWVSSGHGAHWQFTPTMLNLAKAEYTETKHDKEQIITVNLGKEVSSACGFVNTNLCGEIRAPAIQFDLPYAADLWVFLLRSPQALKIGVERQSLSITHALAQVIARLESERYGQEGTLRAYVNMHGEGFNYVEVAVKRTFGQGSFEEVLGEVKDGGGSFTWRPTIRDVDAVLSTWSSMGQTQFLDFLKSFSAEIKSGVFSGLQNAFVLCDGPAVDYSVILKGDKKYIGKEEDRTKLKLNVA